MKSPAACVGKVRKLAETKNFGLDWLCSGYAAVWIANCKLPEGQIVICICPSAGTAVSSSTGKRDSAIIHAHYSNWTFARRVEACGRVALTVDQLHRFPEFVSISQPLFRISIQRKYVLDISRSLAALQHSCNFTFVKWIVCYWEWRTMAFFSEEVAGPRCQQTACLCLQKNKARCSTIQVGSQAYCKILIFLSNSQILYSL